MDRKILRVWLQMAGHDLHPVSRNLAATARALGEAYLTQGVLFCNGLSGEESLQNTGLDEILAVEVPGCGGFYPELQAKLLTELEPAEIILFPATPEGRTLSAMLGARLHTGVTADCTDLRFDAEGRLLQTRPAFSGNRLATIVTGTDPQIASLRFAMPVLEPTVKTKIIRLPLAEQPPYPARWLDSVNQEKESKDLVIAVGGGIRQRQDLDVFFSLADHLGAELCCSRALVERGWMPRSRQIGLSGKTVRAGTLVTFGISGSVQFRAGLAEVGKLIAVDSNPNAPIMGLADLPIQGDLYEISRELEALLQAQ